MSSIANAFNKSKDKRSAAAGAWWDEFVKNSGVRAVNPRAQMYQLPDGTVFQAQGQFIKRIGNAILNKDDAGFQSAVQEMLSRNIDPGVFAGSGLPYPKKTGP
jgi:hypothetical protein